LRSVSTSSGERTPARISRSLALNNLMRRKPSAHDDRRNTISHRVTPNAFTH
jgi:hypothetical protein